MTGGLSDLCVLLDNNLDDVAPSFLFESPVSVFGRLPAGGGTCSVDLQTYLEQGYFTAGFVSMKRAMSLNPNYGHDWLNQGKFRSCGLVFSRTAGR